MMCLVAGVSAGIGVAVFLAVPWPWDVLAAPALGLWATLLANVSNRGGPRRQSLPVVMLIGVTSIVLCALSFSLLALVSS